MLNVILFTNHQFNTQDKASALFEFLNKMDKLFVPTRFDIKEPVRKVYQKHDLSEPIKFLSGYPDHLNGDIFVKGDKFKFIARFNWSKSTISTWQMYLENEFFSQPGRIEKFIQFIAEICKHFDIIYGGAAPEEDWDAKHWLTSDLPSGGTSSKKLGLSLERCLPGIYWLTIFGKRLVEHFGREKIQNLPSYRVVDLGKGGILVMLREKAFDSSLPERLHDDSEVVEFLGRNYFFDIGNIKNVCDPIRDVTQGGTFASEEITKENKTSQSIELEDNFENQVVLSPDGEPYSDPTDLAELLIVFLHTDVEEVFNYSQSALEALDSYFGKHPQKLEYKHEHLIKELIPALGAYLGEVFVRELGGNWIIREPLLKSTVVINGKEISPFKAAYKVIYEPARLLDIYNFLEGEEV